MNSDFPFVSIIIPTHNRRAALWRTLAALSTQNYPADRMEVLLVADGCSDDTVIFAQKYNAPWKLRVLEQRGQGPSAARNLGATQAQGEILIFLDDDMEAVPEFVAAHVQVQSSHPKTVAVGILNSAQQSSDYFSSSLQNWWDGKFFRMRQLGNRFRYDDLFSGNFSIQADFFTQVGGFDPELRCHEDYELGIRLLEAGAICQVAVAAAAFHHDTTDISRALQRRFEEGKADIYLSRKHFGLHEQLPLAGASDKFLGRILRYLAFRQPIIGNQIAKIGQRTLPWLEYIWLFGFWRALFYVLQDYWYWRGVATDSQPSMIQKLFSVKYPRTPKSIIDLSPGVALMERQLDLIRPSSARIFIGMHWVGDIPDLPGMERLKGEHLRRILATEMYWQLTVARSFAALMPPLKDEETIDAWQKAWEAQLELGNIVDPKVKTKGTKKIVEIDLSNGIPDMDVSGFSALYALIRGHGRPLGCVTLSDRNGPHITSLSLYQTIIRDLGHPAIPVALSTQPSVCASWPDVSVIVCTRNRTAQLAECLQSLLDLDYPQYDVLVVDNAPADDQTAQLAANLPVRYIREDRPGLDWARNRGIQEAYHPIVAFIDDDARPDRSWLRAIAQVFNDSEVMSVTGAVLPAKLETPAQNLFEFGYGGMNHGFRRRVLRRTNCNDTQLLWASGFGVGTNMAFRKTLFEEIDTFDVALDVGTPSSGGGDVEMFHRLVAKGYTLVYEPAAIVWHSHRPKMSDLEKLISNNGRSFGCFLLTCARNHTVSWFSIMHFVIRSWLWGWIGKRLLQPRPYGFPRRLVWRELWAALGSPVAYIRSQAHARQYEQRSKGIPGIEQLSTEKETR